MSVTASDIATDFPDANCNPELVKICMRICNDHRITAGDLATNWELLMMNRKGKNAQLTLETLGELEAETKLILERESNKRQKVGSRPGSFGGQFSARPNANTFSKDTAHLLLGATPGPRRGPMQPGMTPQAMQSLNSAATPLASGPSPNGAFNTRTDAGKVVCALNPTLGLAPNVPAAEGEEPLQLALEMDEGASASELGESLMWEKLEERARLLDGQLSQLEGLIDGHENFPPLASVVATGGDEVVVVGRVCCEGEGKLNLQSIFLEGSRSSSNAMRVRLDLSSCPEFALFPGQVVAAIGANLVGHTFAARKIVPCIPPPSAKMPVPSPPPQPHPVTMLAASGPFSTSDDLTYAPLTALLSKAADIRPDALVLIGPFVDEQHPSLAAGDLPVSYEELFERQVLARLAEFIETQLEVRAAHNNSRTASTAAALQQQASSRSSIASLPPSPHTYFSPLPSNTHRTRRKK